MPPAAAAAGPERGARGRLVTTTRRASPRPISATHTRSRRLVEQDALTRVASAFSMIRSPRAASTRISSARTRAWSGGNATRTAAPVPTARAMLDAKSGARSTKGAGGCARAGTGDVVSASAANISVGHHSRPWKATAANDSTRTSVARERRRTEPSNRRGLQHVVGEEELAVHRHHHDLDLVGEPLGDDFLNQQRALVQHQRFGLHALGVGAGHHADALGIGLREQVAFLEFSFAVDHFRGGRRFGVLHRRLLAGLGLETALLNLLLPERQRVLHRIGLPPSLQGP